MDEWRAKDVSTENIMIMAKMVNTEDMGGW